MLMIFLIFKIFYVNVVLNNVLRAADQKNNSYGSDSSVSESKTQVHFIIASS